MKRRRPGPSRHSKTAFFGMSETSRLPRAASQTGPSTRVKPPATFSSVAPGERGGRSVDRVGRRGRRARAAGAARCPRARGARGRPRRRGRARPWPSGRRGAAPSRRGSSVDAPAADANFNHLEMLALAVAGDIVAHDNLSPRLSGGDVAGELVLRRPWAGSTLSTTAVTAVLDCRPPTALGGGSVLPLRYGRGALGFVVCAAKFARGEPEPAVIASE